MTTELSPEAIEELEQAISDSIDMDWQPAWAVRHIAPIIASLLREENEACAKVAENYPSNEWFVIAVVRGISQAIRARMKDRKEG